MYSRLLLIDNQLMLVHNDLKLIYGELKRNDTRLKPCDIVKWLWSGIKRHRTYNFCQFTLILYHLTYILWQLTPIL